MPFSKEVSKKLLAFLFYINSKPKASPIQQWAKPLRYCICLGLNEINETDTGCSIQEPSQEDGYKRICNLYWKYDYETNTVYNSQEIIFPKAKEDWGDIKSIGISDELKNGNLFFYKNLDSSVTINKDQQFYFKIEGLKIQLASE